MPSPSARAEYRYAVRNKITLDAAELGRCMAIATERSGLPFELNRSMGGEAPSFEAFMAYLEAHPARAYDFQSGQEENLKAWILAQPDNSIDPLKLYARSLEMNRGNVWTAILTVHDILRNMARFYETRRYHYDKTNPEEADRFFNKMIDIRGDLWNVKPGELPDHPGTWYRIWGTMLYRLLWEEERGPQFMGMRCYDPNDPDYQAGLHKVRSWTREVVRTLMPEIAGRAVEMSKIGRTVLDHRKAEINSIGSRAADRMIHDLWSLERDAWKASDTEWTACQSRNYLK